MSQGELNIANGSGVAVRAAINGALARLATMASGTSRPADIAAGELWRETDNPGGGIQSIWLYDGTADALVGTINTTTHVFTPALNAAIAATDLPDGFIVDRAYAEYTANTSISDVIPADDTIPQNTEGVQILSASITPKRTTNRVRARVLLWGENTNLNHFIIAALFRNSGANALAAAAGAECITSQPLTGAVVLEFEDSPSSTSEQTYNVRVGPSGGSIRLNGSTTARLFGGVSRATLVLEEIAAS